MINFEVRRVLQPGQFGLDDESDLLKCRTARRITTMTTQAQLFDQTSHALIMGFLLKIIMAQVATGGSVGAAV